MNERDHDNFEVSRVTLSGWYSQLLGEHSATATDVRKSILEVLDPPPKRIRFIVEFDDIACPAGLTWRTVIHGAVLRGFSFQRHLTVTEAPA